MPLFRYKYKFKTRNKEDIANNFWQFCRKIVAVAKRKLPERRRGGREPVSKHYNFRSGVSGLTSLPEFCLRPRTAAEVEEFPTAGFSRREAPSTVRPGENTSRRSGDFLRGRSAPLTGRCGEGRLSVRCQNRSRGMKPYRHFAHLKKS